jgi:hypothetical protein
MSRKKIEIKKKLFLITYIYIMFGWKQDLFVMFFYSKLAVLGGENFIMFCAKKKLHLVQKNIMKKNSPKLTIFQERKKKLKSP